MLQQLLSSVGQIWWGLKWIVKTWCLKVTDILTSHKAAQFPGEQKDVRKQHCELCAMWEAKALSSEHWEVLASSFRVQERDTDTWLSLSYGCPSTLLMLLQSHLYIVRCTNFVSIWVNLVCLVFHCVTSSITSPWGSPVVVVPLECLPSPSPKVTVYQRVWR